MTWIQTYRGTAFDLLEPAPAMVHIEDVAHALAYLCRFTGHTRTHYSVAQHSCLVAEYVATVQGRPDLGLFAQLHDAKETYIGDRSTPMKLACRELCEFDAFAVIGAHVQRAVHERLAPGLRLSERDSQLIKHADMVLLATEKRDLMSVCAVPWRLGVEPWNGVRIEPCTAANAKVLFLEAYEKHARAAGLGVL